ncbi:MAG: transcription factor S [archaeon]|nr:transcription factor S [archaeon]MCR4323387.1 transcription factor S [Nanoarchaeota archaeon]
MEFCPKCGSLLMMKKKKFGCPRCNYTSKTNLKLRISEEIKEQKEVAVVSDKQGQTDPITDFKCEKCGHGRSYFWIQQMRSGDEAESKFYKCVKCKNTVREDD